MVTMQAVAEQSSGGGTGGLILLALGALLWWFVKVQRDPLRLCQKCKGKPPGDGRGNFHHCRRCGGNARVLKPSAWALMKAGVPVPRARSSKQHPFRVPKDGE
jgi:hypothetical protein